MSRRQVCHCCVGEARDFCCQICDRDDAAGSAFVKPTILKETNVGYAASSSAPVPPAGDVEAVILIVRHGPMGSDGSPNFVRAETPPDAPYDIENLPDGFELIDRSVVTRLTAERDRHAHNSKEWESASLYWTAEYDKLQSELTKALELLTDMLKDDDMPAHWFAQRINEILDAHRSPPAAKGEQS